ncbi:enolase-phosphatase E1 [Thunnus thynnus]|uniref:enolase-phosphatase E1 n=1 Tax=Thunnus thynnus TaxID=8237 RepID=UPI003529B8BA
MDPDSPSPITRVERTFWSVWYYITGAVNRFLRPEPVDIVRNDPNSFQESAVDSEPANCCLTEGDTCRGEVDEEQPLVAASLLSSSRPLVAWEHCTTEIDLGPDEENMQDKTLLSRGAEGKASEEGECMSKGQFTKTGNDDACSLIAKDAGTREDEQEENEDRKLDTLGHDRYERHANTVSQNLTDDAMSEDTEGSGRKAGAEEETDGAMTQQDQQKMDEMVTNIQIQEEDSKMQGEVEHDFKYSHAVCSMEAEETEVNLSLEEEDNTHIEAETTVTPEEVENSDGVLQLATENENNRQAENLPSVCEELSDVDRDFEGDTSVVSSDTALMAYDKSGIVSEDDQIVVGQEQMMPDRGEEYAYDKAEDQKEEEDESAVDEDEHSAVIEEENVNELAETSNNQTTDEVPEQENDVDTVTDDSQEDIITACVGCSEDLTQITTTELHKAEFTDREQEHVAEDTEVQTKTRETDDMETKSHETVIDGKSDVDRNKTEAEQERRFSASDNNEGCMEIACATAAVTVKPDGEVGQEISGEFKNIPPGISEGRAVVSQELNSITCEETQEGVPEYNNEPRPYENTIQRILEGGDDEEIQTTQLPEVVESEEPEILQNSGSSSGVDYLLLRERMEEEHDSRLTTTEESKNIFDEDVGILSITDAQESEKPLAEPVIQESGHLFVQEEAELLDSSMKMGISEKEFETHVGSANDRTTKEQQDVTEEFLVEFEVDEGLCDSREADAAGVGHETTGADEDVADETLKLLDAEEQRISFYDESVNAINSTSGTFSFLGDIAESGFLKQSVETEPKLLEDCTAEIQDATIEMQDAGIDMEETSYGFEAEVAEDETQNKNETEILNLQVVEMATELTTNTDEKETPIAGLESSTHIKAELQVKTLETEVQVSGEALGEVLTDTETAEDSMGAELGPKHLTTMSTEELEKHESGGSYAEETGSSVSGRPDVIDEEILDLWIQTALSEETVGTKQQEQQMDTESEPSNEEQEEMQSEKEKEQLGESNSLGSGLVGDTEISSSTAESGILDQSLGDLGTENSETQLLKSSSTESFQGTDDMLASMSESANVSELSIKQPASEPQDLLIEVTAEAGQSYLKEEELITDQESDKLQEKTVEERVESVEMGAASQREIDAEVRNPEDEDDDVEQTNVQDEPLETNVSDSLNEIGSEQSRNDSEASLEEGIVSTDSDLQDETCVESEKKLAELPSLDKPQALWSEDIAESSSGLDGAEVAEQSRTKSEDQMEVDVPVLDFTPQKSRIAVKNPNVRPPKDPRSLLHMPSVEPMPSTRLPVKVPAGVPLGGLGIGIKLPGLGTGFPVLKKTPRVVRDENNPETSSQESETKPEEKDDTPKQDEAQQKPKWMPPRQPGFGNPLMSELKTKLKKTTKE